jgi:UDP-hydrolysing UDP-N-acetyl-D-glucosamine 2-epimerase
MKKKLLVFTSTRADYGLLKPLLDRLIQDDEVDTKIFVSATHLSQKYGYTVDEIKKTHASYIIAEVEHALGGEKHLDSALAMSEALGKYAIQINRIKPDYALVLGDRYEALTFGLACATLMVPLAHLYGGELTYGAVDDKFRHCLTKLAELHFTACEKYRRRIIQMGEAPESVYNVGALGVENALNLKLLSESELSKDLGFEFTKEMYLMTFHPETNTDDYGVEKLDALLNALKARMQDKKVHVIITGVNSDAGASQIRARLDEFIKSNIEQVHYIESLGMLRYLSCIKLVTGVVGNSSSGVLEASSLGTPTLNIGSRQDGREREYSVIDLQNIEQIEKFDFNKLLLLKNTMSVNERVGLFGDGTTSSQIAEVIAQSMKKEQQNLLKKFNDL